MVFHRQLLYAMRRTSRTFDFKDLLNLGTKMVLAITILFTSGACSQYPWNASKAHETYGSMHDASVKAREHKNAQKTLEKMENELSARTSEELIQMFYTHGSLEFPCPTGEVYFLMRDGNALIKKELYKRAFTERDILRKHTTETDKWLFAGYNGPPETVGEVCAQILEETQSGFEPRH